MSTAEVFGRLARGELVIIDGGTGTQLQAEGVPMDDVAWSARANLEHPDVVQRVHEEYIRAGAEVIIANSYASSRAALAPAGLGGRVAEANRAAVHAALRAREAAATHPVAVAGSMSSFSPIDMDAESTDAIEIIRRHFAGPVGVYAETGDWQPPNWVFNGLTPAQYLEHAITWADHGARLIGGCCGVGPEHIRLLAGGLAGRALGA